MTQTELPPEVPLPSPNVCAWCGEPSVDEIVIIPARFKQTKQVDPTTGKRVRVMRKRAITAKVCKKHRDSLYIVKSQKEEPRPNII